MKHIGIKLADGTFYPILEEGTPATEKLDLTTVKDNQTKVLVDVYRSETGTMEDAEYVDTLEVSNLNAHPNGEPDLHLSVSLDENNELSAEVIDGETGKKSEIQVQLVSRTLAEREASEADFALENAVKPSEIPAANEPTVAEEPPVDTTDIPFSFDNVDLSQDLPPAAAKQDDFDIPDFNDLAADEPVPAHTPVHADFELPDLADLNLDADSDTAPAADTAVSEEAVTDAPAAEETPADEKTLLDEAPEEAEADDAVAISDPLAAFNDLPSFDEEPVAAAEESPVAADDALTADADVVADDAVAAEETLADAGDTFAAEESSDSLPDLPDLPDDFASTIAEETVADEPAVTAVDESTVSEPAGGSLDLPDFGDFGGFDDISESPSTETASSFDPFANETAPAAESSEEPSPDISLDDFDLPDFGSSTGNSDTSFDDLLFDTPAEKATGSMAAGAAPAMDFSDLYDKETLEGKSSSGFDDYDEDETVHKTRVPVTICVVCAIICIIATALILFIIPSRYNLLSSRKAKAQKTEAVAEETKPSAVSVLPGMGAQPEPVEQLEPREVERIAPAVEDKIVVAPSPEAVVPEPVSVQEPVSEPKKKADDVSYRIKWGDTLWDISDAYYNNPWRYPKIADYNNIPNPDLIIAGSDILIPAK